jgi:hypothetical protein
MAWLQGRVVPHSFPCSYLYISFPLAFLHSYQLQKADHLIPRYGVERGSKQSLDLKEESCALIVLSA